MAAASQHGLNIAGLYKELNFHAAHLSRVRYKQQPTQDWDARPHVEQLLAIYDDLVRSTVQLQQELYDELVEARLQLGVLHQIERQME